MGDYLLEYSKHYCELRAEQQLKLKWHKKFLNSIQSMCFVSDKNYRSFWYLRSRGNIQLEIMKQRNSKHWFMVHPFSMLRLCWEIFMIMVFLFCLVFLPFKSAFQNSFMAKYFALKGRSLTDFYICFTIDCAVKLLWVFDSLGTFITGYYCEESNEVIMIPQKIRERYMTSGFIIDSTASIPLETLIIVFGGMHAFCNIPQWAFIVIEIYDLYTCVRYRYYAKYCLRIKTFGKFSDLTLRLFFAFFVYFCIINWSLYFSMIIPQIVYGSQLYTVNKTVSWMQTVHFFDENIADQYKSGMAKALYIYIGVTTRDSIYNMNDFLIAIIMNVVGRIYWIFFLILFLEALGASNALKVKFLLILQQLKVYMKQKEVPVFLKKRVNRFYFYRFQAHYFQDKAILGRLTESLRKEIGMYTCERLIHNTEVFKSLPRKVVTRLIQKMDREMYFPNDVIVRENTFGECMYFICSGTVAVWTASEKEICHLEDGDFFGEIALIIEDRKRVATVTAVTVTEVYRLDASDYKKIIEKYPDVYTCLGKYATNRLKTLAMIESKPFNYSSKAVE